MKSENLTAAIATIVSSAYLFLAQTAWFWLPMIVLITLDYFSGIAAAAMDGKLDGDKTEKGLYRKAFLLALFAAALVLDVMFHGLAERFQSLTWTYPYLGTLVSIGIATKELVSFIGNTVKAGAITRREGRRAKGWVKGIRDKFLGGVYEWLGENYDIQEEIEEGDGPEG